MKKHIIIFISSLLFASTLIAQQRNIPAELTTKTHQQHTMMLLGQLDVGDGLYSTNAKDIIYAFIEGECRGTASPMAQHNGLIFLSIGENSEQPKAIELMVWLDERQELLPINETFTFAPFKAEGELNDPVILTLGELTDVNELAGGGWFIGEAYPNPFKEQTIIPYTLPEAASLQLRLFNSMGQLVRTINESREQAGFFQASINREGLRNGVYVLAIDIISKDLYFQKHMSLVIN